MTRAAIIAAMLLTGCSSEETCADDPACLAPSPCTRLSFACEGGMVSVELATEATELPGGLSALASPGDVVLRNDRIVAVIDALEATGLLPGNAARYTATIPLAGHERALAAAILRLSLRAD